MRVTFGEQTGVDRLVQKYINHHPSMTLHDFLVISARQNQGSELVTAGSS
jgi:hypothetical protein